MCLNIIILGGHAFRTFADIITPRDAHRVQAGAGVAPSMYKANYFCKSASHENKS